MATDTHALRVARFSAVAALSMRDLVQGWLDEEPDMSARQVVARLNRYAGERIQISQNPEGDPPSQAVCRHCGQLIIAIHDGRWEHEHGFVGCRAASFTIEHGWDEGLDPGWKASPAS